MTNSIVIGRECECVQGRKDKIFTKGKKYFISTMYQDIDGDFFVSVRDNHNLTVNARASRFNVAML